MRKNNSAAYDFPFFDSEPTSFFVCSTPRSGSTFLCRGLWETKLAGAPKEYFNPSHELDFYERWSCESVEDYIKLLKQHRTSPNGFFGVKTHWNHFNSLINRLKQPISSSFNNAFYIFITRNDKIKQAISWAKAKQTKQWTFDAPQRATPQFDRDLIEDCIQKITAQEQAWDQFFATYRIAPFRVSYERLAADYTKGLHTILKVLDISIDIKAIPPNPLKKQYDQTNQSWLDQYMLTQT